MTIHSTFNWKIIFNCPHKKTEEHGWQQTHFELNFKCPFLFKRIIRYYGEKKERGIDRATQKQVEIDVWDGQPRLISSNNDRLIEKIYIIPFVEITNYYITKFGGQRNREMREYFDNERNRESEYDKQNIKS
jgi:hypothetical protein